MIDRPKIGQRAKWTSLDESVSPTFGKVIKVSPSGTRVQIKWDDDESYSYDLTDKASGVRLLR